MFSNYVIKNRLFIKLILFRKCLKRIKSVASFQVLDGVKINNLGVQSSVNTLRICNIVFILLECGVFLSLAFQMQFLLEITVITCLLLSVSIGLGDLIL